MAGKDYYAILGVPKGSSQKEIRQAYRRLARQHHPDVNPGDKAAEARFKEINRAYEVLSDPEKRTKYDKYGDQWQHADQIEEMQRRAGGRTFRFGQGGVAFDLGDLGNLGDLGGVFESFFGGGRPRGPRRGTSVEQPIAVTLEEAFHGGARTLQLASEEPCATCGGQGQIAGAICHACQGRGVVAKPKRLEVKIPAGVDSGSRIRIAGEGGSGLAGGPRGDLYLAVSVRPHPRFERKGDDLYVDLDVPVSDLVLGAEVEAPTITGKVMLTVPPLTQNGKVFRLAGLGMPRLKGQGRGNLYARVRAKLPEQLDDKERKLFEQLRTAGV
jgi:DnaJ-class molecular chaperone